MCAFERSKKGMNFFMKNDLINNDYAEFISEIKNKIRNTQYEAMKQVNKTLISLYWGIGQEIYNQQQEKGWGKSIVEILEEFPDVKGFSASNLWRMRNFYVTYNDSQNLAPLVREISWSKNIVIMEKCKEQLEREFYIKMTKKYGWTKDVLINHIENKSYEKYLLNQTNFEAFFKNISPPLTTTKLSARLTPPARTDFTSLPSKTIPASTKSETK